MKYLIVITGIITLKLILDAITRRLDTKEAEQREKRIEKAVKALNE